MKFIGIDLAIKRHVPNGGQNKVWNKFESSAKKFLVRIERILAPKRIQSMSDIHLGIRLKSL